MYDCSLRPRRRAQSRRGCAAERPTRQVGTAALATKAIRRSGKTKARLKIAVDVDEGVSTAPEVGWSTRLLPCPASDTPLCRKLQHTAAAVTTWIHVQCLAPSYRHCASIAARSMGSSTQQTISGSTTLPRCADSPTLTVARLARTILRSRMLREGLLDSPLVVRRYGGVIKRRQTTLCTSSSAPSTSEKASRRCQVHRLLDVAPTLQLLS
jgi:hypothetical protein